MLNGYQRSIIATIFYPLELGKSQVIETLEEMKKRRMKSTDNEHDSMIDRDRYKIDLRQLNDR